MTADSTYQGFPATAEATLELNYTQLAYALHVVAGKYNELSPLLTCALSAVRSSRMLAQRYVKYLLSSVSSRQSVCPLPISLHLTLLSPSLSIFMAVGGRSVPLSLPFKRLVVA